MKNGIKVLLVCLAVVVLYVSSSDVRSVAAKVLVTLSPTWDIHTPPPTPNGTPDVGALFPTVTATLNQTCPSAPPIGYGTLTPGLGWLLTCGQCLPEGTSTPTFDFNQVALTNAAGTGTPVPGGTGTPTVTPTITITPTPGAISGLSCSDRDSPDPNGAGDYTCEVVGDHLHIEFSYSSSGYSPTFATFFYTTDDMWDGTQYVTIDMHSHVYISTDGPGGIGSKNTRWFYSEGFANLPPYGYVNEITSYGSIGDLDIDFDRQQAALLEDNPVAEVTAVGMELSFGVDQQWYGYYDVYASDHVPTGGTPTVTPTVGLNYCDVIDPAGYDYESWFDLIGLTGTSECFPTPYISAAEFFGSGWTAFFSFLFPDGVTDFIAQAVIPAQTWCFYGFGFTDIQLFTIVLDPTVFADIGIVLFVIYHFLTK